MTTELKKVGCADTSSHVAEVHAAPEKKMAPGAETVTPVAKKTLSAAEASTAPAKKVDSDVTKADKATNPQAEKVEAKAAAVLPKKATEASPAAKKESAPAAAAPIAKKEEPREVSLFKKFQEECLKDIEKWKKEFDACKKPGFFKRAAVAAVAAFGGESVDEKIAQFVRDLKLATNFEKLLPVVEGWHKGMEAKLPAVEKAFSKEQSSKVKEAIQLFNQKLVVIKKTVSGTH